MAKPPPWHQGDGLADGGLRQSPPAHHDGKRIECLEDIIAMPDQELLSWVTGEASVPATLSNVLLPELLKFRP
jgi:succinate dehydrogenase flavin-adding protein (antitoxin of CptAB toxin-antitoxin module)